MSSALLSYAILAVVAVAGALLFRGLFFARRQHVRQGTKALLGEASRCREPGDLTALAADRLAALFGAEACTTYARVGDVFAPVLLQGREAPPAHEVDGPLTAVLERLRAPLAAGRSARRHRGSDLAPFEQAALQALDAAVVVPIHRGDRLQAFLCLGRKRSGARYTRADLRQLETVTAQLSAAMLRLSVKT